MTIPHPASKSNAHPPAITLDELRAIRARMAVARVRLGELTPRGRRRLARSEVRRAA